MAKETTQINRSPGKPTTQTTHTQYKSGASKAVTREQGGVGHQGRIISTSRSDGK